MTQATVVEMEPAVEDWTQIGEHIMTCVRTRDFEKLADALHPRVRCRLFTPSGLLTPLDVPALTGYFRQWFGEADHFTLEDSQITQVGDCLHIGYRIRLREGGLWHTVEQQTHSRLEGGNIIHFDLLCSGFRLDDMAS